MRQERTVQAGVFDVFAGHEIGRELKAMSDWLDAHRALLGLVAADLRSDEIQETGRRGLPAKTDCRCALFKQYRRAELRGAGISSGGILRRFGPSPGCQGAWSPKKWVLQKAVGAIQAETRTKSIAPCCPTPGRRSWKTAASCGWTARPPRRAIHEPSDSSLLWDAVRVMVRLLKAAGAWLGGIVRAWRDHRRATKKRARAIQFTRGRPKRVQLYRQLIEITRADLGLSARRAAALRARCRRATQPSSSGRPRSATISRSSDESSPRARGACWPASECRPRQAGQPIRAGGTRPCAMPSVPGASATQPALRLGVHLKALLPCTAKSY